MEERSDAIYSIGAVSRMLGIPVPTLRAWEERYGVIVPARTEGTQRLYSRAQVEQLRSIRTQIGQGLSAADAHRLLRSEIEAGRGSLSVQRGAADAPLILLAERDPYAVPLAEYFLRTEGYDVCTALDATQAKLLFGERSPQVVVLDLLISGGAGFRLCAEFSAAGETHVIAVSSLRSADEADRLGASAFLMKPIEPLDLVSAVRDLLGASALVRREQRSGGIPATS